MHNLNYINLAYETLPEDIYSFDFRNIEILYKKQIKTFFFQIMIILLPIINQLNK